jgi:creatinine amidohydrolase
MDYATPQRKATPHLTKGDEAFRAKFRSWNIADLSYVDINEYLKEKDIVLVPMASTEQHGPHLPLYTDTITAIEVATRASEAIGVFYLDWILTTPYVRCGSRSRNNHCSRRDTQQPDV